MTNTKELKSKFLLFSLIPIITSFVIAILFYIATMSKKSISSLDICFSNSCVQNFVSIFSASLKTIEIGASISIGVTTVYGIFIALENYLSHQKTAKFSNHLANYQLFKGFVITEVGNTHRLSPKAINTFKLYNLIFPSSREGELEPSNKYRNFLCELNSIISDSNAKITDLKSGEFKYKPHQKNIKELLLKAGIEIEFLPRRDFYDIESDVLKIIDRINSEFCHYAEMPSLLKRKYI
ncbi:hypothetical protein CWB60_16790 [Pseudoalteromonas sp. S327]|uniref:retron Ec48 family effector membrane protein n=1 Tax=unclassified Pseudoalteromonas TaxID=194690 RepID=UPI00110BBE7C|nr:MULTISPECIES: retron Ec48 family effector membrane protein [unclassified Pseudoalteromonas]TMO04314.1 hypothetical protein CWB60_16790 [Pseudoalteromonas sp. S327]TMO15195.1 hypothetical protein CWB59_15895 [Pseudoalteromonas sp. S326]